MKKPILAAPIAYILVLAMMFSMCTVAASAAEGSGGKYVKDVFIAYGEKKEQAEQWLRDNGWEPKFDLNDGKSSKAKTNAVAVMGIKRTNDPNEAITDMAAMNMKGGYSFDDYEKLVAQKKADITEFINTFIPALNEYRDNYNGKGSAGGKKRAQMAHDLLNKFYDGDPKGEDALNDTGKPLGDLLLNKTKTEIGDDAYNALSAEQKGNVADLQQIILESSGPAVLMIEQTVSLATDTAETSWLDRLDGLTGDKLVENIVRFAPETAGQDLAPTAAMSLLSAHFEDYSKILAGDWINIREDILWFEKYCEDNDLLQGNDSDKAYAARIEQYFNELKEENETRYNEELRKFNNIFLYYGRLKKTDYPGKWGQTLYDFFNPEDENTDYSEEYEYFAPIAAAFSDGQRAALEFLTLPTLLRLASNSDSVMKANLPSADEMFVDEEGKALDSISIYSGINRRIFRKGVALTSDALDRKSLGDDPYEKMWDEGGMADIISYTGLATGAVTMIVGISLYVYSSSNLKAMLAAMEADPLYVMTPGWEQEGRAGVFTKLGVAGKWLMGIGGALMILAAALKGAQIYQYYHRTFTKIPTMIVDEADIVTDTTDENGNTVKKISFVDFAYYEVVKCNRQEIGLHKSAQNGVSDYKSWGCGDAADLGADVGKQWLAIYVNRSKLKGSPILADTLKLQKGSEKMPSDCNACLHMFLYENPVKIDHKDYCYRQDNNGMYLFWKDDEAAFTASSFTAGYMALCTIGGLAVGIICTTIVLFTGRKKREEEAAEKAV